MFPWQRPTRQRNEDHFCCRKFFCDLHFLYLKNVKTLRDGARASNNPFCAEFLFEEETCLAFVVCVLYRELRELWPSIMPTSSCVGSNLESVSSKKQELLACILPGLSISLLPPTAIGRLCEKHDGVCVVCDSYVRPCTLVRICDECNYGSYQGRCTICGGPGVSDAYYCKECTVQEKDVSISLSLTQTHDVC